MGRELKRVPLDFDWSIGERWYGYVNSPCNGDYCDDCKHYAKLKGLNFKKSGCPNFNIDPPIGEGYQLWETTTEGSPISPVFKTLEELAEYCVDNCTTYGYDKLSYKQWLSFFENNCLQK